MFPYLVSTRNAATMADALHSAAPNVTDRITSASPCFRIPRPLEPWLMPCAQQPRMLQTDLPLQGLHPELMYEEATAMPLSNVFTVRPQ